MTFIKPIFTYLLWGNKNIVIHSALLSIPLHKLRYKSLLWEKEKPLFVLNYVHFSFRTKALCDIIHLPAE